MKKKNLILILCLFWFLQINNSYTNESKILIKINNEIITTYDIFSEIQYLSVINENFKNLSYQNKIDVAKNSLIREKIKDIELSKIYNVNEINIDTLDQLSVSYFKRFNVKNIEDFNNFFKKKDINPDFIRNKITSEVLWNQLIYNKYKDKVKIDKENIEQKLKNQKQKEFLLKEILFEINDDEKLEEKYELINNQISEYGFNATVIKFSISDSIKNGGNIGWVKESVLNKKILNNLNKINIGGITEPIVLPGGFLILRIEDIRKVQKKLDLKKEIELIIREKKNEQLNQFSNIYFNKIKKNVKINEL